MWCSMHNLLFWCIHPQSGSTTSTVLEFLHSPEWLSTRPRGMCCTVLHTVHVDGVSESNHTSIKHFMVKRKINVCNTQSKLQKAIKEVPVSHMAQTHPWRCCKCIIQVFNYVSCVQYEGWVYPERRPDSMRQTNPEQVLRMQQCIDIGILNPLDLWVCAVYGLCCPKMQCTKGMVE